MQPVDLEAVGGAHGSILRQYLSVGHNDDGTNVGGAAYDPRIYGAKGDGVTDDTVALQAALNAAAAGPPGSKVVCQAGAVYLLFQAGNKTVLNASGSIGSQGYCLSLPSNVTLDLNGSTLKKGGSTDSALVMNASPDLTSDHDLAVIGGTLDGSNVQLSATALLFLTGCTRPKLDNLRIINAARYGIMTYNNDGGYYDRLSADSCAANPLNFGQPYPGKEERGATFGSIRATNIAPDLVNPFNAPGNSFYGVLQNCTVVSLYGAACGGGVKLQGYSGFIANTYVGVSKNVNGTSANSGTKFQSLASRYTVGAVISTGNPGEGLFIESNCTDVTVDLYVGFGNGTGGTGSDIWFDGVRSAIGVCRSVNAAASGFQIRASAVDGRVGVCQIVNTGQGTGNGSGLSAGVTDGGGTCHFNDLSIIDDQVTQTLNRALSLNSASDNIRILNFRLSSAAGAPFPWTGYTSPAVLIFNPQLSADPLQGEFSPAAAAVTTVVTNNNVNVGVALVQPIIEIVALNAAAQTLGMPRVTFTANTLTFRHAAAAGTEKYGYRIVGYRRSVTQAT